MNLFLLFCNFSLVFRDTAGATGHRAKKFFPPNSIPIFPSVRVLKFKTAPRSFGSYFEILTTMCPDVAHLIVENVDDFRLIAPFIWQLATSLQSLTIQINVDSPRNYFPAVDSAFTGHTKDFCEKSVRKHVFRGGKSQFVYTSPKSQIPKVNSSILDLQGK